jgi:hypothetical protein
MKCGSLTPRGEECEAVGLARLATRLLRMSDTARVAGHVEALLRIVSPREISGPTSSAWVE